MTGLIHNYTAINILTLQIEQSGCSLTVASREGHSQAVEILLSHGALVDYQDNVGTNNYYSCVYRLTSLHHHDIMV